MVNDFLTLFFLLLFFSSSIIYIFMYKNREIYNIACKSIVLTCLEMLFVRLVYIIICCSYCFIIYNNNININYYSSVLLEFLIL